MIRRHKKLAAYFLALTVFTSYVMLDTFVITRVYGVEVASDADQTEIVAEDASGTANEEAGELVITADSYSDGNINIRMSEYTVNDTAVYLSSYFLSQKHN